MKTIVKFRIEKKQFFIEICFVSFANFNFLMKTTEDIFLYYLFCFHRVCLGKWTFHFAIGNIEVRCAIKDSVKMYETINIKFFLQWTVEIILTSSLKTQVERKEKQKRVELYFGLSPWNVPSKYSTNYKLNFWKGTPFL